MTQEEWLECDDPLAMLDLLTDEGTAVASEVHIHSRHLSDRKLRLIACAAMRSKGVGVWIPDNEWALVTAERAADGLVSPAELAEAHAHFDRTLAGGFVLRADASRAALGAVRYFTSNRTASALRCIAGNPFRPWEHPRLGHWCTQYAIPSLALAAYCERHLPSGHLDPARFAVLSDALEEAGCDDADLLSHLRSPGPHVRGCWVVDLLTGRS